MLGCLSACFGGRHGLAETGALVPDPPSPTPGAPEALNEHKNATASEDTSAPSHCNDSSTQLQGLATSSEVLGLPATPVVPESASTTMTAAHTSQAQEATFVALDVAGLSKVTQTVGSEQLETALRRLDQQFAELCSNYGLQRMRFTGQARPLIASCSTAVADASPSVTAAPQPAPAASQDSGAQTMMAFARELLAAAQKVLALPEGVVPFKIGIHTGPCGRVNGPSDKIDSESPLYQTVAVTICIEHSGMPGRIHASERTVALLQQTGDSRSEDWEATEAGVNVKGQGTLCTHYWAPPRADLRRQPTIPRLADSDELAPPSRSTSSVLASFQAMNQLLHLVYASQKSNNSASQTPLSSTSQLTSLPAVLSAMGSNGGMSTSSLYAGLAASRCPSGTNLAHLLHRSGESFNTARPPSGPQGACRPVPFANFSNVIMEALKNPQPTAVLPGPMFGPKLGGTPAR